jgi:hyperosmotically inducible protein
MNKLFFATVLAMPALMIGTYASAQAASHDPGSTINAPSGSVAPDNTKSNKADPSNRDAVADTQKNDPTDIDLAKRIRQSVMADKSLSTYGHNVKIVAVNGTVTLNGVVSTADEKMQIGKKATSIAGEGHVVDDLKVVPPK